VRAAAISPERAKGAERVDVSFILIVVALTGLGLATLYSGSVAYAGRLFGDPLYFVRRQLLNVAVGIVALVVLSLIDLEFIRRQLPRLVLATFILSVLPFLPGIGVTKNGAARWFVVGPLTFQPSELVKLVLVIFLANLFAKKHNRLDEVRVSVVPAACMSSLFAGIVYLQNNFSTAFFILAISLTMFFVAGVSISWFLKLCAVALPFLALMVLTKEYRMERVMSFLHPERDPLGAGYQVNAALEALSVGGFWGRGIGNGIRKISSIPEVQSDFIFAVWAEEMGFIGVLAYFALIVAFAARGLIISLRARDRFRSYLGIGCTAVIFYQSIMNCAVVARVFPATGVPLPFFSSGGSSILITLCLCGLIINVSRRGREGEEGYV